MNKLLKKRFRLAPALKTACLFVLIFFISFIAHLKLQKIYWGDSPEIVNRIIGTKINLTPQSKEHVPSLHIENSSSAEEILRYMFSQGTCDETVNFINSKLPELAHLSNEELTTLINNAPTHKEYSAAWTGIIRYLSETDPKRACLLLAGAPFSAASAIKPNEEVGHILTVHGVGALNLIIESGLSTKIIGRGITASKPDEIMPYVDAITSISDHKLGSEILWNILRSFPTTAKDSDMVLKSILPHIEDQFKDSKKVADLSDQMASTNPQAFKTLLPFIKNDYLRASMQKEFTLASAQSMAATNSTNNENQLIKLSNQQESSTLAETPIRAAAELKGFLDPLSALNWARSLPDSDLQTAAMEEIFRGTAKTGNPLKAIEAYSQAGNNDSRALKLAVETYTASFPNKQINSDDDQKLRAISADAYSSIRNEMEASGFVFK